MPLKFNLPGGYIGTCTCRFCVRVPVHCVGDKDHLVFQKKNIEPKTLANEMLAGLLFCYIVKEFDTCSIQIIVIGATA